MADPAVPQDMAHDHAAMERAEEAHGHGHGGHAGMSMDSMVRDMRNRFLVALVFTVPIVLWSMVGTELLGTELATPTAIMVGSGLGAKRGILFKNAIALEQVASLDTIVVDKTGTLTRGEPEVVAVAGTDGVDENEVLRLVAAAEGDSEHPLAEAIVKAASSRGLDLARAESFEAVPGHGLLAPVDGHRLAVGNARLLGARGDSARRPRRPRR